MFPTNALNEIVSWLQGNSSPGVVALIKDVTAILDWAVGQLPSAGPMPPASGLSKAEMLAKLQTLGSGHPAMVANLTMPPWLLPLLLQLIQVIVTNIGQAPAA